MNYAVVENGVVTNIIVGKPSESDIYVQIPEGLPVGIGDTYDSCLFIAPDGTVRKTNVEQLTERLATVESALVAMQEGVADA